MSIRIWFHGTMADCVESILRKGFLPRTYFANALEDALEFGGDHVFFVALDHEPNTKGNWQMRINEWVPPDTIIEVRQYKTHILRTFPERRSTAFPKTNS